MSHSLTKVWIHSISGTKLGEPLIHPSIEKSLHNHMQEHLGKDFDCTVRIINGMPNHLHILFLLNVN